MRQGGYDLTGRYYPNAEDALNTEMAQVAEIDARYAIRTADRVQQQVYNDGQIYSQHLADMDHRITELEEKIKQLEQMIKDYGTGQRYTP